MPRVQGSLFSFQRAGRHEKVEELPPVRSTASRDAREKLSKAERMLGEVGINRPATSQGHATLDTNAAAPTLRKFQSKPSLINGKVSDTSPRLDWDFAQVRGQDMLEEFGLAFANHSSPLEIPARSSSMAQKQAAAPAREEIVGFRSTGINYLTRPGNDSPVQSCFDLSKPYVPLSPRASTSIRQGSVGSQIYTPTSEFFSEQRPWTTRSMTSPPISPGTAPPIYAQFSTNESATAGKRRPTRLDLSKLFPKQKMVNSSFLSPSTSAGSSARRSLTAELVPARSPPPVPATEPTTGFSSHALGTDPAESHRRGFASPASTFPGAKEASPVQLHSDIRQRNFQHNIFENAKVHVRKPPKGIQNWFDGFLDSDSSGEDEDEDEDEHIPTQPNHIAPSPSIPHFPEEKNYSRRTPTSPLAPEYPLSRSRATSPPIPSPIPTLQCLSPLVYSQPSTPALDAESIHSLRSRASRLSDLQTRSVLSVSDSSDSGESSLAFPAVPVVRRSVAAEDNGEDAVIGKAEAYVVKLRNSSTKRVSQARLSSSSGNSAAQEPQVRDFAASSSQLVPQSNTLAQSSARLRAQWSGHTRQPSVIPEADSRPNSTSPTPETRPTDDALSETAESTCTDTRTLARRDIPPVRIESLSHKLMMVTEEEEALLAMMRRKRAAMAKHSFTEGYKTALHLSERRGSGQGLQGLRVVEALEQGSMQFAVAEPKSPLDSFPSVPGTPLKRRPSVQSNVSVPASVKSFGSASRHSKAEQFQQPPPTPSSYYHPTEEADMRPPVPLPRPDSPPYLPQPQRLERLTFSAFDMISKIGNEPTSPASRRTASPSPLPSPMTPRRGSDVVVKVAGSEPSSSGSITDTTASETIGAAITEDDSKTFEKKPQVVSGRRRTASSEADIIMGLEDEQHVRTASVAHHHQHHHHPPHVQHQRLSRSQRSSIANARSIDALHEAIRASKRQIQLEKHLAELDGGPDRPSAADKSGKRASQSTVGSARTGRKEVNSVSEELIAAWGSLGGWGDVERLKAARA